MSVARQIAKDLAEAFNADALRQIIRHCETSQNILTTFAKEKRDDLSEAKEYLNQADQFRCAAHYLATILDTAGKRE